MLAMAQSRHGPLPKYGERIMVNTTREQRGAVRDYAARQDITETEAIRRLLDRGLRAEERKRR